MAVRSRIPRHTCPDCIRFLSDFSGTTLDAPLKLTTDLTSVADLLRWMTTHVSKADVYFGHATDNAWDEAVAILSGRLGIAAEKLQYVLAARLTEPERNELVRLLERRIVHRVPAPYLVGGAWVAGCGYV